MPRLGYREFHIENDADFSESENLCAASMDLNSQAAPAWDDLDNSFFPVALGFSVLHFRPRGRAIVKFVTRMHLPARVGLRDPCVQWPANPPVVSARQPQFPRCGNRLMAAMCETPGRTAVAR
jgi:hypothetical protein